MNRYFVITIDVEPDCTPNWRYSNPLTFHGVRDGIRQRLQPLFNKYNVIPTYLINNVVLEDDRSVDTFLSLEGNYELGTHLHCEFIQPEKQFDEYAGKKGAANQCFLAPEVEFQKMRNITVLFEDRFQKKPTSFRAGRFSAGSNTIRCLETLGYKVDTSVTPHITWNDPSREKPVDYRKAHEQPYFIKQGSFLQDDFRGKILEVPVSIISASRFLFLRKAIWLRPFLSPARDFKKIIDGQTRAHQTRNIVVFNMMFHNVEVLPKMSPYPQTESESKVYLDSIDAFLAHCRRNQIKSIGLSDLYDIYRKT
jgi:hypothetical protein